MRGTLRTRLVTGAAFALALCAAACARDPVAGECGGGESRCRGGNLESCVDGRFQVLQNCAAAGLECRETPDGALCASPGGDASALDVAVDSGDTADAAGPEIEGVEDSGPDGAGDGGPDGAGDGGPDEGADTPDTTPDGASEDGAASSPPQPGPASPLFFPLHATGRSAGGDFVLHGLSAAGSGPMTGGAGPDGLRLGPLRPAPPPAASE